MRVVNAFLAGVSEGTRAFRAGVGAAPPEPMSERWLRRINVSLQPHEIARKAGLIKEQIALLSALDGHEDGTQAWLQQYALYRAPRVRAVDRWWQPGYGASVCLASPWALSAMEWVSLAHPSTTFSWCLAGTLVMGVIAMPVQTYNRYEALEDVAHIDAAVRILRLTEKQQ